MADRELYTNQMLELRYPDISFAHGLMASLFIGNIMRNNRSSLSNLSPFTIFKQDPLSITQTVLCLHLHLLSKNTEGKSMKKIKASQMQEVKVPTTFKELLQTLLFYSGIIMILFGPKSILVVGMRGTIFSIRCKKIMFKTRIAADSNFPTKFLFVIEICTQHWLGGCMQYDKESMVNDHIINFDPVIEMVLNSSLNVILPPSFIKSPTKNPTNATTVLPGEDNPTRKKWGKKRKSDNTNKERMVKNTALINEFLIEGRKVWKHNFAGKCTRDHPKWDCNTVMCVRWFIRGKCFCDCGNKASLVGACAIPTAKTTILRTSSRKIAGRTPHPPWPHSSGWDFATPGLKKTPQKNPHLFPR
jgi:hypothetical protein